MHTVDSLFSKLHVSEFFFPVNKLIQYESYKNSAFRYRVTFRNKQKFIFNLKKKKKFKKKGIANQF